MAREKVCRDRVDADTGAGIYAFMDRTVGQCSDRELECVRLKKKEGDGQQEIKPLPAFSGE
jgi:O-succinylbenzoate synthase